MSGSPRKSEPGILGAEAERTTMSVSADLDELTRALTSSHMAAKKQLVLLIVAFVLAACGTNIEELEGTAWRLTEDGDPSAVRTVHINNTGLTGFDGCSPWFSESDTSEAPIQISTQLYTDPGTDVCDREQRDSAERFQVQLGIVTDIDLKDGELQLRGDDSTLRFEPAPPLDTDRLADVEWKTRFLSESSSLYDLEGSPSFFLFSSDGSFEAHTGCRSGSGTWRADRHAVNLLTLTMATWDGPLECRRVVFDADVAFTRLLDGANAYIVEDRLFISSSDWSSFAVFNGQSG